MGHHQSNKKVLRAKQSTDKIFRIGTKDRESVCVREASAHTQHFVGREIFFWCRTRRASEQEREAHGEEQFLQGGHENQTQLQVPTVKPGISVVSPLRPIDGCNSPYPSSSAVNPTCPQPCSARHRRNNAFMRLPEPGWQCWPRGQVRQSRRREPRWSAQARPQRRVQRSRRQEPRWW